MDCSLCPNKYRKYFRCTSMIQKDLLSFGDESSTESGEPDSLVLELLKISCGKNSKITYS